MVVFVLLLDSIYYIAENKSLTLLTRAENSYVIKNSFLVVVSFE